jgi:methyltransferase (TIGR00027 family)
MSSPSDPVQPPSPLIANVSDTARWVAVYRAMETARKDALFKDPLADRLAGERGRAIAAAAPRSTRSGWPLITRTRLIDDLIATSLREGCDRVLNLAAGLDTRPYRLELPATLEWIEADLPGIVDEKERVLANEKPRCVLRRERVDLADPAARETFLTAATAGASRVLVITEGLLVYLDDDKVRALGKALARPEIRWWMLDISSAAIATMMQRRMGDLRENAPMQFAPENGVAFIEALGWRAREIQSFYRWALRFNRLPLFLRLFSFFPDPNPRRPGRGMWAAVARFERA